MKKLLILLLLLPSLAWGSDLGQDYARMNPYILGGGASAACTASYGSELATASNATDDLGGNETDAITGWSNTTCGVFDSISTGTPHAGTYHLFATSDTAGDYFYRTLTGLSASTVYRLAAHIKHDGTENATWACGMGPSTSNIVNQGSTSIPYTATTYTEYEWYFLFNTQQDTFGCRELSALDSGSIYLDNFTITAATLCYGSELYTHANAANIASESDATTGWTAINSGTVESVETGTPHNGSSHLAISGTGTANGGAAVDIGTDFSLVAGHKYFLRFWAMYDGSNIMIVALSGNQTSADYSGSNVQITNDFGSYTEFGFSFVYSAALHRYLKAMELNAGNTGTVYIDGISIKEITGE